MTEREIIKNPDKSIYDFEYPGSDEAKTKRGGGGHLLGTKKKNNEQKDTCVHI